MLTIGQLASYAGVTVRAVRHYHQIGLLPEQPALVSQQNLQPLARHGCGRSRGFGPGEQPQKFHAHAALRPSRRFIRPILPAGTVIWTVSPSRRRVASR